MSKEDCIEVEGVVIEVLRGGNFKVNIKTDKIDTDLLCSLGSKLRLNKVRILLNDRVKVEMSPYDLTRGRIIWRYK